MAKRQKRKILRRSAKTQGRGKRAISKSRKRHRPTVKAKVKRTPLRKVSRRRKPIIRSRKLPRKGVSKSFRQFVTSPRAGRARESYAFVEIRFDYAGKKSQRFIYPLKLGFKTKVQLEKITLADIEEDLQLSGVRGELVAIRGFAHLKARRFRKGKTIRKNRAKSGH